MPSTATLEMSLSQRCDDHHQNAHCFSVRIFVMAGTSAGTKDRHGASMENAPQLRRPRWSKPCRIVRNRAGAPIVESRSPWWRDAFSNGASVTGTPAMNSAPKVSKARPRSGGRHEAVSCLSGAVRPHPPPLQSAAVLLPPLPCELSSRARTDDSADQAVRRPAVRSNAAGETCARAISFLEILGLRARTQR